MENVESFILKSSPTLLLSDDYERKIQEIVLQCWKHLTN